MVASMSEDTPSPAETAKTTPSPSMNRISMVCLGRAETNPTTRSICAPRRIGPVMLRIKYS